MADADERIAELERDLAEALERQSAAAHVLEVLGGSTFELDPVFETVLAQAVRLCRADAGLIYVHDGDVYRVEAALGASQAYRDYITDIPLAAGSGGIVGRVDAERRTVQIHDAASDPGYTLARALELGGFHTMLGVPMLAEERVLGVIVLWRKTISPFDDRSGRELGLRPVMTVRAPVLEVRDGTATIGIGSGDGIHPPAIGAAEVLVAGERRRITRLDVDSMTIDVGGARVGAGDDVIVFGPGDDGEPTAEEWARWAGTIGDEIVARVRRIPRVYR